MKMWVHQHGFGIGVVTLDDTDTVRTYVSNRLIPASVGGHVPHSDVFNALKSTRRFVADGQASQDEINALESAIADAICERTS